MMSLLLSLCLAAGLFTAMGATAYADGDTITYTLVSGDTVASVCAKLGINFAANKDWIVKTNNISDFTKLAVGRKLTLPAAGKTLTYTAAPTTTATGTVAVTTAAATNTGLLTGDTVSYYLVSYVVRSGDTLFNICRSYNANMDTVQAINGIGNAARIAVGKILLIPSSTAPTSGSFTKVVAHKVVSGDTVLNICNKYGISYDSNAATIKQLNNKDNLNVIKVGQTILIPVPATAAVAAPAATTPTTGTTATSIANTNTTTTAGQYYTLNPTGAVNGTYSLTVNGQSVNSANAGTSVHVVVTPDHGYKLNSIVVTNAANNQVVSVDGNNNFTMPSANVRVSVTFAVDAAAQPHYIYNSSATQKNVIAVVNGVNQTSVEPGKKVNLVVSEIPAGYAVDKLVVSTVNTNNIDQVKNNQIDSSLLVPVAADYSFTMPGANVYVTVVLKTA
jgi:murein DD-endopeptidase MepM/ murein hydrolase activator NlpD